MPKMTNKDQLNNLEVALIQQFKSIMILADLYSYHASKTDLENKGDIIKLGKDIFLHSKKFVNELQRI